MPDMVVAYCRELAEEVSNRLAQLGVRSLRELTGWYDRLGARSGMDPFLVVPISESNRVAPQQEPGLHVTALEDSIHFDATLAMQCVPRAIQNSDRSVGAGLSGELMRRKKNGCAPDAAISQEFCGTAGQSFGAFLAEGVTVKLTGEANDYVGKGMSGGRIVIVPPADDAGDPWLVGNTVLFGATGGELFVAGRAGERFGVRESGATAGGEV